MTDYLLPDDGRGHVIHVSGGRTSGYMLRRILDAHGGSLPGHARAVFCNTGKERAETLDFLVEMQARWAVDITWLEYTYRADLAGGRSPEKQKNWYRVVDRETASLDGRPFEELIRSREMLPNCVTRFCTSSLKVETTQRWIRHEAGWKKPWDVLGIRWDEQRRLKRAINAECRVTYPLAEARDTLDDVMRFWAAQPFDLALRPHQGNCDLCFLKGQGKIKRLIRENPEAADWWIRMEDYREAVAREMLHPEYQRFLERATYRQLRDEALSEGVLPLEDEGGIDCFCGD